MYYLALFVPTCSWLYVVVFFSLLHRNSPYQARTLLGQILSYGTLSQYYLNAIDLPEHPDSLIIPSRSDESVGLGPDALPESAQICSCFDVTKGQICSAVESGCHTMPALKDATKAATGCGGCTALLKSVLD